MRRWHPTEGPMTAGFGAALREAREARGLSQEAVARRLDITTSTYRNWEHERAEPRVGAFLDLCLLLGWNPSDTRMWSKLRRGNFGRQGRGPRCASPSAGRAKGALVHRTPRPARMSPT